MSWYMASCSLLKTLQSGLRRNVRNPRVGSQMNSIVHCMRIFKKDFIKDFITVGKPIEVLKIHCIM